MSTSSNKSELLKQKDFRNSLEELKEKSGQKAVDAEIAKKQNSFLENMEDDDKATNYIRDTEEAKLLKARKQKEEAMNYVDIMRGSPSSYRVNLAEWGMWKLMSIDWPLGWEYHCVPSTLGSMNIYGKRFDTKEGILFVIRSPAKQVYIKAMSCSYKPEIDIPATTNMVIIAENTLDSYEGKLEDEKKKLLDEAVAREKSKIIIARK